MYIDYHPSPSLEEIFEKIRREKNLREGRASNQKGRLAEKRVLEAAQMLSLQHKWLSFARYATGDEDNLGRDIIVGSHCGDLYIQVKSSHRGAKYFRHKRKRCKAIVIIITPEMSEEQSIRCTLSPTLLLSTKKIRPAPMGAGLLR